MGTIGVQEMMVIFLLALVLFGPKKLPELGRTIGKALTEFRRASSDLKASFEREMHNLEREVEASKEPASQNTIAPAPAIPTDYEYGYYDSYGEPYNPSAASSSTVSATEVSGAESHGVVDSSVDQNVDQHVDQHVDHAIENGAAPHPLPAVEGTVPRTETTQHS